MVVVPDKRLDDDNEMVLMEMIVRYPSPPIRAGRRAKTVSRTFPRRQILLYITQHLGTD